MEVSAAVSAAVLEAHVNFGGFKKEIAGGFKKEIAGGFKKEIAGGFKKELPMDLKI
ncbi:MAG: hypothetical protein FWH46_03860 [Methanimicrococcus sp.]|nr:hypothetical protein [Methanimicrococcus sp.]